MIHSSSRSMIEFAPTSPSSPNVSLKSSPSTERPRVLRMLPKANQIKQADLPALDAPSSEIAQWLKVEEPYTSKIIDNIMRTALRRHHAERQARPSR